MNPLDLLTDHTFRMVVLGTSVIGVVAGALGCLVYLRRQSLVSDVISHAALPGTLLAFLALVTLGLDGRNMSALLLGAVVVGTSAVLLVNRLPRVSRIKVDAAMAIVLSMYFGAGLLLLRVISDRPFPGKGGIQDYLFGDASVVTIADLVTSTVVGAAALAVLALFWKEITHRAFDPEHAGVLGFSPRVVDTITFAIVVVATVVGVKSVGLVLMVAFVVTPPAAARQWTRTMPGMVLLAAAIGGLGSATGAYLSIALGGVPTGPVIVLVLFVVLVASLLLAPGRSVLRRWSARRRLRRALVSSLGGAER